MPDVVPTVDFLLVIPAFEESRRLPGFLQFLAPALQERPHRTTILIVDDGSSQSERQALLQALQPIRDRFPAIVEPLLLPENQGKGGAIMAGWNSPHPARWLAFVDADGAISAEEVCRVFDHVAAGNDERQSIFASRIKMLGRSIKRGTKRHFTGRIYAFFVGCLIDSRVYDTQCGFKIVARPAWEIIRGLMREKRFAFDVELASALLFFQLPVEEMPVDWADQPGSKISLFRDTFRMFASLFRIRARRFQWTSSKKNN